VVSEHRLPAATTLSAIPSAAAIPDRLPRDESVVDGQVGARPIRQAPLGDAPGEHVAGRLVGDPAAPEDALFRLAGGGEAGCLRGPAENAQRLPPAGTVQPVDGIHQGVRHVLPDGGLAEGARTGDEGGYERGGVPHALAFAEAPAERGDVPRPVGEDLHRPYAHAHHELAVMPGGSRAVQVAVDAHVAALVGLRLAPSHGVEGDAGELEHACQVLLERLRGGTPVPVGGLGVQPVAAVPEHPAGLLQRACLGHGHEEVAPQEPDGVLHRALLVPRIGVAVAALAAVVGPELGEEPRLCDLAEGHPPRLGGVVEDEHARRAPRPLEDAAQPPAEDLGPLAWQRHAEARVRVREARHQELQGHAHAAYRRHEVAEVDLGRAWGPPELEEAILRPLDVLPLPAGHVPAYRGVGSGIPLLGDRPVVDPLGRMALLPWHGEVGLEYRVDPPRYPVGRWMRPLLPGRRLRRHVLHVRVLPDGVPAEMELARYVGPRRPIPVHPPDILLLIQGHGHAPFLLPGGSCQSPRPEGKHSSGRAPDAWDTAIPRPICSIPDDHGARCPMTICVTFQ
jgi:hypothetical protein